MMSNFLGGRGGSLGASSSGTGKGKRRTLPSFLGPKAKRANSGGGAASDSAAVARVADSQPAITASLLTPEQLAVANKVLAGENVFLTGAAGTGKSYLFKYLVAELNKKHGKESVAVGVPVLAPSEIPSHHPPRSRCYDMVFVCVELHRV